MAKHQYFLIRGLLRAFYWVDEGMQNYIRAAGFQPMSRSQAMVMGSIAGGMRRPADLARSLGVSRQAVHQLLADMEGRGLVDLRPDPDDARAKLVHFSRRGSGMHRVAMHAQRRIQAELEKRLGRTAVREFLQVLLESEWGPALVPRPKSRSVRAAVGRRA
ncbi:MAG: MarR family transcriptional regulator [Nevskia sp.]|nr:MarR family transcriptional regulator [Nevskia sp.]